MAMVEMYRLGDVPSSCLEGPLAGEESGLASKRQRMAATTRGLEGGEEDPCSELSCQRATSEILAAIGSEMVSL